MQDMQANGPLFQEEEIDLQRYGQIIWRRKWSILGLAFAISLITALVVLAMKPVYQASTTVLIESEQAKAVSIEEVYGLNTGNAEYFLTQFEILKSRELAVKVIEKLDLRHHPEFDPDQKKPLLGFSPVTWLKGLAKSVYPLSEESVSDQQREQVIMAQVVSQFLNQLSISPTRKTQLVQVNFESYTPELAAKIANTLVEEYIHSHLEANLQVTMDAAEWLTERLDGLKSGLDKAEKNLQAYRDEAQLIDVQGVQTINAKELDVLTTRFVEASRERSEAESIYQQVRGLNNPTAEQLMSIPAVLEHSLVQTLQEAEGVAQQKRSELTKRYGPKHPKMIGAVSNLRAAQSELRRQVVSVVSGIEKEYQVAARNEAATKRQLNASKKSIVEINRKEFKLRELERDVQTNRRLYDLFFTRIKETDEASGFQSAHARIVDHAVAPVSPIKPKKSLIVILAFMVSGMLGVMLAFLQDALDNTLKTPEDIDQKLGVPMLGIMPKVQVDDEIAGSYQGYIQNSKSSFSEAVRSICTGVVLSGLDNPHKITVVTSSVPGEGKSTLAFNLASALAQMEKVLLLDADMRRPTLAKTCELPPNSPGLSNLVAGTSEFKDCLYRHEQGGFDYIPAGMIPSNPLELLSSEKFKSTIKYLGEKYDRVIIDSAPVQAVSDSLMLATLADSLIFVVRADSTSYKVSLQSIQKIQNSNLPFTGVVLNRLDTAKLAKYSYGKGSYYGGYYYGEYQSDS